MSPAGLGFKAATSVGEVAGSLILDVASRGGRTEPIRAESQGVLRLLKPLYLDDSGQLTHIVVNPGGAYFGEKYRFEIGVESGASLLLATQGATRIHRTPVNPAVQEASFRLAAGSRLEYLPEQTIAYKDADYRQYSTIVADPSAQGFFSEVLTPGWDPEDAKFTYSGMHLRIELRNPDDRPVCIDNLRIRPAMLGHAISQLGYLEGHSHLGSVLVCGPQTADDDYEERMRAVADECGLAKVGLTRGSRHGVSWLMLRALANSTDQLSELIAAANELDRSLTTGQRRVNLRRY